MNLVPLGGDYPDSGRDFALTMWTSRHDAHIPEIWTQVFQNSWDKASVSHAGMGHLGGQLHVPLQLI